MVLFPQIKHTLPGQNLLLCQVHLLSPSLLRFASAISHKGLTKWMVFPSSWTYRIEKKQNFPVKIFKDEERNVFSHKTEYPDKVGWVTAYLRLQVYYINTECKSSKVLSVASATEVTDGIFSLLRQWRHLTHCSEFLLTTKASASLPRTLSRVGRGLVFRPPRFLVNLQVFICSQNPLNFPPLAMSSTLYNISGVLSACTTCAK